MLRVVEKGFNPQLAAHNISHPNRPDTATACTIPRGTVTAAPTVSSDALAEASNPVIV